MPGSSLVARRRNSPGERRASVARQPRNQPPNAGACRATARESRSPGAIPRVGHPGGPSGETSVRLRTRPGIPAAHAAANGPPAEIPSSAAASTPNASSTSLASSTQSTSRRRRRGSVPPTPGRSGATTHHPSSRAARVNRCADSRESASPWQHRSGVAPCSPTTSTAITLPSPRLTSIPTWSRVWVDPYYPPDLENALVCGNTGKVRSKLHRVRQIAPRMRSRARPAPETGACRVISHPSQLALLVLFFRITRRVVSSLPRPVTVPMISRTFAASGMSSSRTGHDNRIEVLPGPRTLVSRAECSICATTARCRRRRQTTHNGRIRRANSRNV